jgi:hypothetical protein
MMIIIIVLLKRRRMPQHGTATKAKAAIAVVVVVVVAARAIKATAGMNTGRTVCAVILVTVNHSRDLTAPTNALW